VRWFLNHKVDANVETYAGRTAISDACRIAPLSMVRLLVELGQADVKDKDVVAQAAIAHNDGVPGRLEVVEYILDLGAPIDMYANVKVVGSFWSSIIAVMGLETALQHATKAGKQDMVKLLVERGADKNLRAGFKRRPNEKLETALEMAEERGFEDVIELLR
jgi:ankyrin repeat protein